jgi:hypothetical protein
MTDFFNPGPNPGGNPPILLAVVGEHMTGVAGRVANGGETSGQQLSGCHGISNR